MIDPKLIKVAKEIKTPLSFLALVIIITEALLLVLGTKSSGIERILLIVAMILVLFATLGIFYLYVKNIHARAEEGQNAAQKVVDFASERLQDEDKPQPDISGLYGTWKSTWYLDGEEEPYVEDHVWIKGIRENKIMGKGEDDKGIYNLEGFFERGILTLVYKYVDRGYSLTGVIVLEVGPLSKSASGQWYGYLIEGKINGGRVEWEQISDNILDKPDLELKN